MITLTQHALQQLTLLNALERAELTVAEAAWLLGRSTRQVRRLRRAYRRRGPKGPDTWQPGTPVPASPG